MEIAKTAIHVIVTTIVIFISFTMATTVTAEQKAGEKQEFRFLLPPTGTVLTGTVPENLSIPLDGEEHPVPVKVKTIWEGTADAKALIPRGASCVIQSYWKADLPLEAENIRAMRQIPEFRPMGWFNAKVTTISCKKGDVVQFEVPFPGIIKGMTETTELKGYFNRSATSKALVMDGSNVLIMLNKEFAF
jgi:hypothetical protein